MKQPTLAPRVRKSANAFPKAELAMSEHCSRESETGRSVTATSGGLLMSDCNVDKAHGVLQGRFKGPSIPMQGIRLKVTARSAKSASSWANLFDDELEYTPFCWEGSTELELEEEQKASISKDLDPYGASICVSGL